MFEKNFGTVLSAIMSNLYSMCLCEHFKAKSFSANLLSSFFRTWSKKLVNFQANVSRQSYRNCSLRVPGSNLMRNSFLEQKIVCSIFLDIERSFFGILPNTFRKGERTCFPRNITINFRKKLLLGILFFHSFAH